MLLRIYMVLAAPVLGLVLIWRIVTRRESWADAGERLVLGGSRSSDECYVWVHGASVGETTAARGLIERILRETGRPVVVTVNTATARSAVEKWRCTGLEVRLAPMDALGATRRFLRSWEPLSLVSLEHELWPGRLFICSQKSISVFAVSARLSVRAARAPLGLRHIRRDAMDALTRVWPMDDEQRLRLRRAGVDSDKLAATLNLKLLSRTSSRDRPADDNALSGWAADDLTVLLAASTHAGEEEIVIAAFVEAVKLRPGLRLIIAPRHSERRAGIAALLGARSLSYAQRTKGQIPDHDTPIYLADTMHEMALWYGRAAATIIGGSFVDKGGHTPVEPVMAGSPPIHGPYIANHRAAFDLLARANATLSVDGGADLGTCLANLPGQGDLLQMAKAGQSIINEHAAKMNLVMGEVVAAVRDQATRADSE